MRVVSRKHGVARWWGSKEPAEDQERHALKPIRKVQYKIGWRNNSGILIWQATDHGLNFTLRGSLLASSSDFRNGISKTVEIV